MFNKVVNPDMLTEEEQFFLKECFKKKAIKAKYKDNYIVYKFKNNGIKNYFTFLFVDDKLHIINYYVNSKKETNEHPEKHGYKIINILANLNPSNKPEKKEKEDKNFEIEIKNKTIKVHRTDHLTKQRKGGKRRDSLYVNENFKKILTHAIDKYYLVPQYSEYKKVVVSFNRGDLISALLVSVKRSKGIYHIVIISVYDKDTANHLWVFRGEENRFHMKDFDILEENPIT